MSNCRGQKRDGDTRAVYGNETMALGWRKRVKVTGLAAVFSIWGSLDTVGLKRHARSVCVCVGGGGEAIVPLSCMKTKLFPLLSSTAYKLTLSIPRPGGIIMTRFYSARKPSCVNGCAGNSRRLRKFFFVLRSHLGSRRVLGLWRRNCCS